MWEEATAEVKEDYGKDYHFDVLSFISRAYTNSPKSIAPVINAMEDALLTEDPKIRYLIGGGKGLYDKFKARVVCIYSKTVLYYVLFLWGCAVDRNTTKLKMHFWSITLMNTGNTNISIL